MSRYHRAVLHLLGGLMAGLLTFSTVQHAHDLLDTGPRTVSLGVTHGK